MKKIAPKLVLAYYVAVIVVLCLATFLEKAYGTDWVHAHVYSSVWFVVLWGVMAAGLVFAVVKRRLWHNVPLFVLHLSFIFILCGGFFTWLMGEQGIMHVREGMRTESFVDSDGNTRQLPFSISLRQFFVNTYPGTVAPSDFVSEVTVHDGSDTLDASISMNNILRYRGYRFYQTSYDEDAQGSILSVNHDPVGIAVTYSGYFLFFLSFVLLLLGRKSPLRSLAAQLRSVSPVVLLALSAFMLPSLSGESSASAQSAERQIVIPRSNADSLVYKLIVYKNRIAPFNTMAHDVVTKLYGKPNYHNLTPEQVVGSFILYPREWSSEKIIKIKSSELRRRLGIEGKYASISDLYEADGSYKLQKWWNPDARDELHKAIAEVDEKVALLTMLASSALFTPAPDDAASRVSMSRVKAEVFYNRMNFSSVLFKVNLTLGLVAFIFFVISVVKGVKYRRLTIALSVFLSVSLLLVAFAYALRWYIAGYVPLTNGYETMLFISLAVLVVSEFFTWRSLLFTAAGLMLSGFPLLVSSINSMNPQITSLMPVLSSPWLSTHVSVVMISYALFAFATFVSIAAVIIRLVSRKSDAAIARLLVIDRILLLPALAFLGCGIFLGAVWANVSWGSYWSWDAKEVWALITMMVYAIPVHSKTLRILSNPIAYHIFVIFAFLVLLMTYFGVNVLFSGMHSYQ